MTKQADIQVLHHSQAYRFTLDRLAEQPGPEHARARRFCLDTIKEVYGFDYRFDWHQDLDSLLLPPGENHYSRHHGGGFWTLRTADGALAATAGIQHLAWKPNILTMFHDRYRDGKHVASLCRMYVRKDLRRNGLGRWLSTLCEAEARALGYPTMYLHASSDAPQTLAFWQNAGYERIATCETSTHFDKRLGTEQVTTGSQLA